MPVNISNAHLPETEKFLRWYEKEKEEGLVRVHFFSGNIRSTTTQEDFFREQNLINTLNEQGKEVLRSDVF